MCELLGMSANVPTDICFSFTGLMQRGGNTGPHRDGWGIAFYEGRGLREFRDPHPSCDSEIARLVRNYPIKSQIVVSHIRQANVGAVQLENTHPFTRELWGQYWTFAHNGQIPDVKAYPSGFYQPVGDTDSECAFCWLMNQLRTQFPERPSAFAPLWQALKQWCDQLRTLGVFNLLFTDGEHLYCYCTTKLHWITRRAPFSEAVLSDTDVRIDFKEVTTPKDVVTVVATEPLTTNESWQKLEAGTLLVFRDGELLQRLD